MRRVCRSILTALLLCGCTVTGGPAGRFCESREFLIDARFEAGAFDRCSFTAEDAVEIVVRPEDPPPINESPWYAFRVSAKRSGEITIRLSFEHGYARYWPKLSRDLEHWAPADGDRVRISEDGASLEIDLEIGEATLWVTAQEIVGTAFYEEWMAELAARDDVTTRLLGRSVQERAIRLAEFGTGAEAVLLLGRQHPPEVTGAFAMRSFVDALLADTALAREFRRRHRVVVIPLLNPDGVALGHWRHNVNGVDLNRDWGKFTQPETSSVARLLAELDHQGVRPGLMLDFHSTKSTLFYTQLPEDDTEPPRFATRWLNAARDRLPGFEFAHEARARSGRANTKNYFFQRYGIPAITFEIGDAEDRQQIAHATPIFAEEMMRLLLE